MNTASKTHFYGRRGRKSNQLNDKWEFSWLCFFSNIFIFHPPRSPAAFLHEGVMIFFFISRFYHSRPHLYCAALKISNIYGHESSSRLSRSELKSSVIYYVYTWHFIEPKLFDKQNPSQGVLRWSGAFCCRDWRFLYKNIKKPLNFDWISKL